MLEVLEVLCEGSVGTVIISAPVVELKDDDADDELKLKTNATIGS